MQIAVWNLVERTREEKRKLVDYLKRGRSARRGEETEPHVAKRERPTVEAHQIHANIIQQFTYDANHPIVSEDEEKVVRRETTTAGHTHETRRPESREDDPGYTATPRGRKRKKR